MGVVAVAQWKFGAWRVVVEGTEAAFTVRSTDGIAAMVRMHTDPHSTGPGAGDDSPVVSADDVVVRFQFPGEVAKHLEKARQYRATGQHSAAERELGHAALKLRSKRMPPADIAACLGVTEHEVQRASTHGGF
jgi:hypothetical protein